MILKFVTFLLFIVNGIALYFYIDGLYVNPDIKSISRHDLIYLAAIDIAFILFYLIEKMSERDIKEYVSKNPNVKFLRTMQSLTLKSVFLILVTLILRYQNVK